VNAVEKEALFKDLWHSAGLLNAHLSRCRLHGFKTSVTENRIKSGREDVPDHVFIVVAVAEEPVEIKETP
jgi:hypothetical protein